MIPLNILRIINSTIQLRSEVEHSLCSRFKDEARYFSSLFLFVVFSPLLDGFVALFEAWLKSLIARVIILGAAK